jgi:phage shock protein A
MLNDLFRLITTGNTNAGVQLVSIEAHLKRILGDQDLTAVELDQKLSAIASFSDLQAAATDAAKIAQDVVLSDLRTELEAANVLAVANALEAQAAEHTTALTAVQSDLAAANTAIAATQLKYTTLAGEFAAFKVAATQKNSEGDGGIITPKENTAANTSGIKVVTVNHNI